MSILVIEKGDQKIIFKRGDEISIFTENLTYSGCYMKISQAFREWLSTQDLIASVSSDLTTEGSLSNGLLGSFRYPQ